MRPLSAFLARFICGSLGLDVIAEGVETQPQREIITREGCHAYQGYFPFSRPLPLADFAKSRSA